MAGGETLSWRAIRPGHRIVGRDGDELGTVHRVLADEGADIFHGVSLRRGLFAPEVEITADRIERISEESVQTNLGADEAVSLPAARNG